MASEPCAKYTPAFGYGSNIWDEQMENRCPDHLYIGIAKLDGWKWVINSRQVATIIPSPADHVWGTVLLLHAYDEHTLDLNEGPDYDKCYLPLDIKGVKHNPGAVLVYVDRNGESDIPSAFYVTKLKKAMKDGLAKGIPQEYFDKYWLPFLMLADMNPGIYTISELHTYPASPPLLIYDAGAVTMRRPFVVLGPKQQWRITPGNKYGNIIIQRISENAQPLVYLTYEGAPKKPKEGDRVCLQVSDSPTEWRIKVSPGGSHFIRPAGSDLGIKYIPNNQDSSNLVLSLNGQVEWAIRLSDHTD